MPASPPEPIELRQFLSDLALEPIHALGEFGSLAGHRLTERWSSLLLIAAAFLLMRYLLGRARERAIARQARIRRGDGPRRIHAQRTILISLGSFLTWVTTIILTLSQLGLSMNPQTFSLIIGSLSLTAVFVMRPYLADALEGWVATSSGRIRQGDFIDVGLGVAGNVVEVGMWSTRLRGSDGTIFHLRNTDLSRLGNRTQSVGKLLTDIELTPEDESFVTSEQLTEYELIATDALVELRAVLRDVDAVARQEASASDDVDLPAVAAVTANLVPSLASDTLASLRSVDEDDTGALPLVSEAIAQAPMAYTPIFRDIEILGLVTSTPHSVTIRVRVVLADQRSRSYALGLLRRSLFDAFNEHRVATGFSDVPEDEWIS